MLFVVAFSAILIPLVLVVMLKMPARRAMPMSALSVALLAAAVWEMDNWALAASILQGAHRAMMIIWILLGAVFFMYALQRTGAVERIKQGFMRISADMRVQTVIVAFAFVAIIEGVSGFGTPAAVGAPLLVALGFHPMSAVVLALVGDSVPTSFGAVGTPLFVGLENVDGVSLAQVGGYLTIIDGMFGLLLPLALVSILVLWYGRKTRRFKDIAEIAPWALLVGLVYVVTSLVAVRLIGIEFTSILSGVVALVFAVVTARRGFLMPKNIWREHALPEEREVKYVDPTSSLVKAWMPYVLVILLLLVQRTVPAVRELLGRTLDFSWEYILGFWQIESTWQFLLSPGTVLVLVAIFTLIIYRSKLADFKVSGRNALRAAGLSALALLPTLMMVQIFVNSGINHSDLVSMPNYIARTFSDIFAPIWVMVSPILGTITAFIVGSSTISTLTMSPVQASVATQVGLPLDFAMAQQISGANTGNLIAIHNVVAASTVVELHHQEGRIIRRTILLTGVYLICSIAAALVLLSFI